MSFIVQAPGALRHSTMPLSITTFSQTTLGITTFSIVAEHFYAECRLCWLSLMLGFTYKSLMLSVFMLNVVMLSVLAPGQEPTWNILHLGSALTWKYWTEQGRIFSLDALDYLVLLPVMKKKVSWHWLQVQMLLGFYFFITDNHDK